MKVISICIDQLKPGMILAEDLRDSPTGIVLLSPRSKITEKLSGLLNSLTFRKMPVYFADQNRTFTESSLKDKAKKNKQIPVRIGKINLKQKNYTKTLIKL